MVGTYMRLSTHQSCNSESMQKVLTSSPYIAEVKAKVTIKKKNLESRHTAQQAKKKLQFNKPKDDDEDAIISADDGEDDVPCLYCNELFSHSKPKESWTHQYTYYVPTLSAQCGHIVSVTEYEDVHL